MIPAPPPPDDAERLLALHALEVLDTGPEAPFDDLVRLASESCGTPIALVSLVDTDRQWFKARHGIDASQTSRDVAFCAHAILKDGLFVVEDATRDPRFLDNPLVTGAPFVEFYAGAPLVTADGHALGTLCVIDHKPRRLTQAQRDALEILGRQVVALLTARRAAQRLKEEVDARRAAEAASAKFFDISLDLLCVAGVDGRFHLLNPAWERVLGYPLDQLVGARFLDLVHPDDVERTVAEVQKLSQGAVTIGFVNRFRHRDGSWRTFEWRAAPDVSTGRLYAAASDVTAQALEAERFRTVLDAAATGMMVVDASGTLTLANREAERLLGVERDGLLGRSVDEFVPPRFRSGHASHRASFAGGPARPMGAGRELHAVRADGTEVPVEVALTTVQTDLGPSTLVTVIDVSARREVERLKTEFISVVSHELRTPLTSIRGSLRLLESGVKGALPEGVRGLVRIASGNTERLIRLINDILDIEKIEAGRLELRRAPTRPAELLASATEVVRGMGDTLGVRVESAVRTDAIVDCDPDRVGQVLVNLLSNALKYSAAGGRVVVTAEAAGRRVRFSVKDDGPGIAAADQGRLFGKFRQLDASDARARGGTGLGLAISKAIIEQHGGTIGVDSVPGTGSTFWFELFPSASVPEPSIPDIGLSTFTQGRALVVEDDEDAALVVQMFLEREGLSVERAATLHEARARITARPPSVVVLDLQLPDGHGFTLVEWMRSRAESHDTPVVVVSGSSPSGDHPAFVLDWVEKPLDDAALSAAIRRIGISSTGVRALVVEDDDSMRTLLLERLNGIGVNAVGAVDGGEALRILRDVRPDLIVLDVGLPEIDGFGVVDVLREGPHRDTSLIVFSGRDLRTHERAALTLGPTLHLRKAGESDDEFLDAVRRLLRPRATP